MEGAGATQSGAAQSTGEGSGRDGPAVTREVLGLPAAGSAGMGFRWAGSPAPVRFGLQVRRAAGRADRRWPRAGLRRRTSTMSAGRSAFGCTPFAPPVLVGWALRPATA